MASDGVWEFLSSEDVVEIVKGCAGDADRVGGRISVVVLRCMIVN